MKTALSLKGRALQCAAQREHSRVELRRKLLAHARAALKRQQADDRQRGDEGSADAGEAEVQAQVEAVLDWMQAKAYLSDERFVESRIHARASRFGNLRIRGELAQHGVTLSPEVAQALRHSEKIRALEVWRRKFDQAPSSATERARQMRFLAGRGFSAEAISQVLREVLREPPPDVL